MTDRLVEFVFVIMLYAIFCLFEVKYPAQDNQGFSGKLRNVFYTMVIVMIGGLATVGVFWAASAVIPFEARHLTDHGMWFSTLILVLYLFLMDVIFYWYHRAQHASYALWQIHELHHSDAELNVSSSMRSYWIERPLQALIIAIPATYLIGIDTTALAMLPVASIMWLLFAHSNIRLQMGWLSPVICGPQVHRIHHSNLPMHRNKNFAQYFPIIDIIFGTYYKPVPDEFPTTGIQNVRTDASIIQTIKKPFATWWQMVRASFKKIISPRQP